MSGLDLVVRGGSVIDGSGAEPRTADVGIAAGRIVEVGRIAERGNREIDAEGHVVTPGFIDGHTHMDAQMHWDWLGTNSCWHGVTTAVTGNCGFSIAPMRSGEQALVARNLERAEDISGKAMDAGIDWRWETFDSYLDVVDSLPKGINYATYVGHSALRTWAMGERAFEETAGEEDLDRMTGELRRALDAGAIGFSTSRSAGHETSDDRPVASRIADRGEVEVLVAQMQARAGAVFEIAHEWEVLGTETGDRYFQWIVDLSVNNGVTTTYGVMANDAAGQLALLDRAAAAGGRIVGQSHSRGVSALASFQTALPFDKLPEWKQFRKRPLAAQAAGLRDPETRDRLVEAVKNAVYGRAIGAELMAPDWSKFFLYDKTVGACRSLAEIAEPRGLHPVEAMIDEALARDMKVFFMQPLSGDNQDEILLTLRHPRCAMTFSDAGAHVSQIADASIHSHLVAYWHREKQAITLPEAVQMMTQRPAEAWNFTDRGLLREGYVADLNIFDANTFAPELPEVVHDLPTGATRLSQRSRGMKATIVAGEVLIDEGQHTGALPGRLLRRMD